MYEITKLGEFQAKDKPCSFGCSAEGESIIYQCEMGGHRRYYFCQACLERVKRFFSTTTPDPEFMCVFCKTNVAESMNTVGDWTHFKCSSCITTLKEEDI